VKNVKDTDTNQNCFPLKVEVRIMQVSLIFIILKITCFYKKIDPEFETGYPTSLLQVLPFLRMSQPNLNTIIVLHQIIFPIFYRKALDK
jgi:hypothetical protein